MASHQSSKAWQNKPRGWERIRLAVLQRDDHQCQLKLPGCTEVATHVDHIVARGAGGTEELGNLQAACAYCNHSKGDGSRFDPKLERRTQW